MSSAAGRQLLRSALSTSWTALIWFIWSPDTIPKINTNIIAVQFRSFKSCLDSMCSTAGTVRIVKDRHRLHLHEPQNSNFCLQPLLNCKIWIRMYTWGLIYCTPLSACLSVSLLSLSIRLQSSKEDCCVFQSRQEIILIHTRLIYYYRGGWQIVTA